jgi:UDP-N-acetylmuramoyl-L-alanyl-D-glutamate--2,6-diaminopimelate ligase
MRITPISIPAPVARLRAALERAGQLISTRGDLPEQVYAITDDSRKLTPHTCFVAVRGSANDGHQYLPGAAAAGASLVICEDPAGTDLPALVVKESRVAAAIAAAAFHDDPAKDLRFVGVTGTNGKTTTVGILRHLLDEPGAAAASIGTLGVLRGSEGATIPGGAGLTTPGPIELQRILRQLRDGGVRTIAMEVSSHALHQRRVLGVRFDAAVFTNLTRDHLDYHVTMEAYFEAKALLVDLLTEQGAAVVNADDAAWAKLPRAPRTVRFGEGTDAEVRASDIRYTPRGSEWTLHTPTGTATVALPLIGDFNVTNALGAAAAAHALGLDAPTIAARLSTLGQVPGRLELLSEHPTILRDYAHTPDALERALVAMRPFTPGSSSWCSAAAAIATRGSGRSWRRPPRRTPTISWSPATTRAPRTPSGSSTTSASRSCRAATTASRTAAARSSTRSRSPTPRATSSCSRGRDTRPTRSAAPPRCRSTRRRSCTTS